MKILYDRDRKEADIMVVRLLGIMFLLIGIWQTYIGRKMNRNIKKNVKNPVPYVFVGVYISFAMGIILIISGIAIMIK